ncbi:MAG TPA: sugar transferase [Fibrobacteraceae bacterium]|nr:sugar transferase [Fibrobacteraceae bacterium]
MIRASTLEKYLLLITDFVALWASFYLAFYLQFHSGWIADKVDTSRQFAAYTNACLMVNVIWILLFAFSGLYRKWLLESRALQILIVLRATTFGIVLVIAALFGLDFISKIFFSVNNFPSTLYASRFKLVVVYGFSILFSVSILRLLVFATLSEMLRRGHGMDHLLVLGANHLGSEILAQLRKAPELGQRVVGFMDERWSILPDKNFEGLPILGKYADLEKVVRQDRINGIIIAHESTSIREVLRIFDWVAELPIHLYVVPDLYDVVSGHFKGNLVHGVDLQEVFAFNMPPWQVRIKRLMDIVVAGGLLLLTSPILLLAAIAIKLDSKGPVFYSQERVGLYGRPFIVHKFRTMRTDAEKGGPQWATKNDPRITHVGHWLRRSRIDEIPQLICVLQGDMSMVGPRPERAHFVEQLRKQIPFYMFRLKMKPGLTGWAQVRHSYDSCIEDVQKKLKYDMYYFENMSLLLDLQILFRTIWVVISGKGAQ